MTTAFRLRSAFSFGAVALATLVVGCAEPAAPPAPPVAKAPPVTLSPRVIEAAAGYRTYMTRAAAISPAFADGPSIAQSLSAGASYEPKQLVSGAIAYGAIVALQDPAFVAGVRAFAADPAQRQSVAYSILRDPAYAVGFEGSAGAAGAIIAALGDQGRLVYDQGKLVKQAAYDIQRSNWSKADVIDRPGRLQQAKTLSAAPLLGDSAEAARLQQAALGVGQTPAATPPAPVSPPYTPLVIRSLAVAALAALGQAGDASLEQVNGLMSEPNAGACLNLSKLNLYQCLAVSKPHYEDVFCLGEHVMMDTGRCLMKSSGAAMPLEIKPKVLDVTYRDKPKAKAKPKAAAKKKS